MQRKSVIFVADSLDNAHKFQAVLSGMDADVVAGSSLQKLLHEHPNSDLIIFEASGDATQSIAMVEDVMVQDGGGSILIIVKEDMLQGLRLPVRLNSDFVVQGASADECALRIRQLLWPGNETSTSDFISIDTMTINLATYLEYALLAFLVTHPGRTYSRDALLRRVWGFDYFGGSRTVDVHVRRVRAKLGPDLAQRLETVRGVGYLWSA